jgi:hypothetical protein
VLGDLPAVRLCIWSLLEGILTGFPQKRVLPGNAFISADFERR